jgi:hypothetical protein
MVMGKSRLSFTHPEAFRPAKSIGRDQLPRIPRSQIELVDLDWENSNAVRQLSFTPRFVGTSPTDTKHFENCKNESVSSRTSIATANIRPRTINLLAVAAKASRIVCIRRDSQSKNDLLDYLDSRSEST